MLYVPERLKLWLGWITITSGLFTVWPAGPYGLLGWLAAVSPLLRKVVPGLDARVLAAAVLAIMLVSCVALDGLSLTEMILPPIVFILGLLLTPVNDRFTRKLSEGIDERAESIDEDFRLALNREVSRCRRHNRPMTLLSASSGTSEQQLSLLEDAVVSVVHMYALSFRIRGGLLVIVPELAAADSGKLKARIEGAAAERHLHQVSLHSVSFPEEETTTAGLLAHIDRARQVDPSTHPRSRSAQGKSANGDYGVRLES